MFCTKCGNQIADGNRFCSKCGTPVANIPTPAANGNVGYNPGMNNGYAPNGNVGYNPAMNNGYAPNGNVGYNPGMNNGYAPNGNVGYNPAMNNGYAPNGNVGFNPTNNNGFAANNAMNQTPNSAPQYMTYTNTDEDEEKTEMFDSTPIPSVDPADVVAPVVAGDNDMFSNEPIGFEDEEKTEMLESAPVEDTVEEAVEEVAEEAVEEATEEVTEETVEETINPEDVVAPAVTGDNDMFSNEPIGLDDDMFSNKPIGFDEPIEKPEVAEEAVAPAAEETAEEAVEEVAEEVVEETVETTEETAAPAAEETVEETVEEVEEVAEETVEETVEAVPEEDDEKTEMFEDDQTQENIEATPIGIQPVKVETINVQPSFGTAGVDAAANTSAPVYNAAPQFGNASDAQPVYNAQPAYTPQPAYNVQPADSMPEAPKKKKHTGLKIFLFIILLVLVIGGGIVGFLFYSQAKREKDYENHLKNAQKYIDDLEYELAVAELDEAIKIEGQDDRAKDLMVTTYDDWAVYVVDEDEDYEKAVDILDEGYAKTEAEDLQDTMVDTYLEWTDFVLVDDDYEKAVEILEEGIEKTDSDELQDRLDEVEADKQAYDEQQEWLGTLNDVFTEVAKYCSEDDYSGLFEYMTTDEYAEFVDNLDKLDKTTDVDTDYGNVGIYIIDSKNYGNYMLYYGDYVSGKREGYGDWFGYYEGNNYHAAGYWDDDSPNGPQTVREWSTQLDSSVVYRVIEGSTVNGLWDGAVDWCFELGNETQVFPCTFEDGYVVKLRETSGGYTVSDGTGDGTMYFTYDECEMTHGIVGYEESSRN